ncbi:hypothetical protein BGW80DRAFT_1305679 [Lactifluus volemus]|nr:hypothetical protein BGW80DRAFT_1305679 [Lactifluus volemus]
MSRRLRPQGPKVVPVCDVGSNEFFLLAPRVKFSWATHLLVWVYGTVLYCKFPSLQEVVGFQPLVVLSIPSACSLSPRPPTSLSSLSLCSAPGCSIRLWGMHSLTQMFKGRCDEEVQSDIMQEWYFFPADRLSRWCGVQILAVEHGSNGGVVHSSLGKCIVTKLEPLPFYSYNQKLFRHF